LASIQAAIAHPHAARCRRSAGDQSRGLSAFVPSRSVSPLPKIRRPVSTLGTLTGRATPTGPAPVPVRFSADFDSSDLRLVSMIAPVLTCRRCILPGPVHPFAGTGIAAR